LVTLPEVGPDAVQLLLPLKIIAEPEDAGIPDITTPPSADEHDGIAGQVPSLAPHLPVIDAKAEGVLPVY
jgi:hypothetical protein